MKIIQQFKLATKLNLLTILLSLLLLSGVTVYIMADRMTDNYRELLLLMPILALFIIIVVIIMTKRIINPIRKIVLAAQNISNGKFNHLIEINGNDEFSDLAKNINNITLSMRDYHKQVEERTNDLSVTNQRMLQEIIERKQAEKELEYRIELVNLITLLSTTFINLTAEEVEKWIYHALKEIGKFIGADSSYIFILSRDNVMIKYIYEWYSEGSDPRIDNFKNLSLKLIPWWIDKLKQSEIIHITSVSDMPPKVLSENEFFQLQETKSIIVIPMLYSGTLVGFLRFDSIVVEKKWSEYTIALLKVVGEVLVNALERKRVENELINAREAALDSSRIKSDFLANMSHEIRTPMNGIIGATELVLDTELTDEQKEYLGMVKSSADSLITIINDILDFSKIEAGKLDLELIDFRLRDSIGNTLKALALRAYEKDLELIYHITHDVPDSLIGDPTRLRQIIINLVGNAIKFTEEGEIRVNVDIESEKEDEVFLHFSVSDTGIGIPKEKREHIFDSFTQADGSTTRKYGGTGLGLAICAQLVDMMTGKIWVNSEIGKGSAFHFTVCFSLQRDQKENDIIALPVEVKDLHVLIVDGNATNRCIFKDMLTNWNIRTKVIDSSKEALNVLQKGEKFALVILNANMPDIDGFTLAERIKEEWNLSIVMLTYSGKRGDAARCKELGISAYLTKPVKQSELLETIKEIIGKRSAKEKNSDLITRHSLKESRNRLNILLAEDNIVNQRLVVRILEKRGHNVAVANDGKEAIEAFEKGSFDLILMDVQMPDMGGFEATEEIRKRENGDTFHIPIIALTAHAMEGYREKCIEAGMDGYLSKPINPQKLYETIEMLAGNARALIFSK